MTYLEKVRCREIFLKGGDPTVWQARLSDFTRVKEGPTVKNTSVFDANVGKSVPDPVKFIQENGAQFSVYSLDFDRRVLGLVRVREGIDIRKAPFLYQAQRENAEELLLVPFDVLPAVADALRGTQSTVKNIFLYNTGRCGSTLMCKAMDVINGVQAVSEPDVFSEIIERVCIKDVKLTLNEEEEIIMLLRCSVILLNFYFQQNDPARTVICYKLRCEGIFIANLLQKAVPKAKALFMYRGLPGFYDSYLTRIFQSSYWRNFVETTLRLDVLLRVPKLKNEFLMPKLPDKHPHMAMCPVTHGIPFIFVSVWILHMQKAFDLIQEDSANFFHACISYEQPLEHKERVILKVLETFDLDIPLDVDSGKIREVFGFDSQEGSAMQSGRKRGNKILSSWVGTWEWNFFSNVLEHFNGDIDEPNFRLPNTMVIT